ncbi:MAG TPA: HPF/RaiA family ribosome-associated protein [Gemmatimonadales bacterium]|nr:HPF/RaiA family ribosome-associated protein [Gemmatimonadales bacterium]
MIVQLNTDANIQGTEALKAQVDSVVRGALEPLSRHITRVEVHLSDTNSDAKDGPADIRCLLEARPAGRDPVVASHHAATVAEAVDGAAGKLKRALESVFGRLGQF